MARFALHPLNLAPSTVQIVCSCGATRKAASVKINLCFGLVFLEIYFLIWFYLIEKQTIPRELISFLHVKTGWTDQPPVNSLSFMEIQVFDSCKFSFFYINSGFWYTSVKVRHFLLFNAWLNSCTLWLFSQLIFFRWWDWLLVDFWLNSCILWLLSQFIFFRWWDWVLVNFCARGCLVDWFFHS